MNICKQEQFYIEDFHLPGDNELIACPIHIWTQNVVNTVLAEIQSSLYLQMP